MARGPMREEAILAATLALLESVGYDKLTMDAVAAEARASKATIYRRWRNKAQLVKAALDRLDAGHNAALPDTGTLRGDLIAVMQGLRARAKPAYVAMIHGLIVASRHDHELAAALRSHTDNDELSPFHTVLRRAIARTWLPPGAPEKLVHDVAEAMIMRQLQIGAPFNRAFITRVVDKVLLPLLGQERSAR